MAEARNIKVPIGYPHYTINILLLITSVITLMMSLALKYEFSIFENYLEYYTGKPILFILVGSLAIFADAFLGFVSLRLRSYRGIITFVVCTMYLFVSMIALVALTYVFSINAEKTMYSRLKKDMANATINSDLIDTIQLNCCGYENFDDWKDSTHGMPRSCCRYGVICDTENSTFIRTVGCRDALVTFLSFRKFIVAGILIVLGIVEISSIVLSLVVYQGLIRSRVSPTSAGNEAIDSTTVTRIRNPLGSSPRLDNPSTDDKSSMFRTSDIYVRRPSQRPVVLDYRSPHESFLRQAPQIRFDRRVALTSAKHKNP